jgi:hypothetical protein
MTHAITDNGRPYLVVDSPYQLARWRPLVNWVLYIPHAFIRTAVNALSNVVFFVYWLKLIFTGKLDPGLYGVMAMYERYNSRTGAFLLGYSEDYPPFDFDMNANDNAAYPPVRVDLPEAPEAITRSAALNLFKAIPHYIVVMVFLIGALFVAVIAWFAVLFTGKWPQGMRDFLVRVSNYYYRVWTYVVMVENDYPRFALPAA